MASTAHFNKADAQKTPPLPLLPVDNEASELTILLKAYLKTKDIQRYGMPIDLAKKRITANREEVVSLILSTLLLWHVL
jgi:hypothetical protein